MTTNKAVIVELQTVKSCRTCQEVDVLNQVQEKIKSQRINQEQNELSVKTESRTTPLRLIQHPDSKTMHTRPLYLEMMCFFLIGLLRAVITAGRHM